MSYFDQVPVDVMKVIHNFLDNTKTIHLEKATKRGNFGAVKVLVNSGVPFGRSLRFAVILKRKDIAKYLVSCGASVDQLKDWKLCEQYNKLIQC
jgi:hypothetical protein